LDKFFLFGGEFLELIQFSLKGRGKSYDPLSRENREKNSSVILERYKTG
jgi:hypothetical protein